MASELRVTTIANNAGSESVDTTYVVNGSVKAWACINQTSSGHPTRDSLNVSTTTDSGGGSTRIAFTNNMNNEDFCTLSATTVTTNYGDNACSVEVNTGAWDIYCDNSGNTNTDSGHAQTAVLGDLA